MAQSRISQTNLGNSKLDNVFIAASIVVIFAGFVSVEAGIVDELCRTQTEKDISGVEKQLQLSDVHGIELDPQPTIVYAATCCKGKRKFTKCSFTSEEATPKTRQVQLEGSNGRARFTLKKDLLSYECHLDCYDVMGTHLWCTYPLFTLSAKTKRAEQSMRSQFKLARAIDVDSGTQLVTLPTVIYDADCTKEMITKCSIPSMADAKPFQTVKGFKLQAKVRGVNSRDERILFSDLLPAEHCHA